MSENKTNGQIQIADEVVGVIATTAALEVEGVVAGGGKGFVELFGKKGHTKCAKITKDADEAVLDMDIIVNFGTKVQNAAKEVKAAGANMLRGGAFKPRTSPYAFQGLGSTGLDYLVAAKKETGLPIVSELMSADDIDEFNEKVDLVQIGARNMQNFTLLKEVGARVKKPILLKRGLSATYQEWIMSAEYIMASGNENVILCERGVRTFETYTRNTLDLQAIPVLRKMTHLPVIIDPSHAGGKWWLVEPMAKASVAAGCDGLLIEVHNDPEHALCDGAQSLKPEKYTKLISELREIGKVVGKEI